MLLSGRWGRWLTLLPFSGRHLQPALQSRPAHGSSDFPLPCEREREATSKTTPVWQKMSRNAVQGQIFSNREARKFTEAKSVKVLARCSHPVMRKTKTNNRNKGWAKDVSHSMSHMGWDQSTAASASRWHNYSKSSRSREQSFKGRMIHPGAGRWLWTHKWWNYELNLGCLTMFLFLGIILT